jgi:hypothetical protein
MAVSTYEKYPEVARKTTRLEADIISKKANIGEPRR